MDTLVDKPAEPVKKVRDPDADDDSDEEMVRFELVNSIFYYLLIVHLFMSLYSIF